MSLKKQDSERGPPPILAGENSSRPDRQIFMDCNFLRPMSCAANARRFRNRSEHSSTPRSSLPNRKKLIFHQKMTIFRDFVPFCSAMFHRVPRCSVGTFFDFRDLQTVKFSKHPKTSLYSLSVWNANPKRVTGAIWKISKFQKFSEI